MFVENNNIIESKKGNIKFTNTIDFNMLASSIPKSMINEKCFNEDVKNLILSLAFVYNIDELNINNTENAIKIKTKFLITLFSFITFVLYIKYSIIEKLIIVTNNNWKNPSLA